MAVVGYNGVQALGALACQRDAYLQELETTVVSCEPAPGKDGIFRVVTLDTVLFPEGGGQPADRGTLGGAEVVDVQRDRGLCVHFVKQSFAVGDRVTARVDWTRRFDHMQQHTGQHVVSAVIEKLRGFRTVGWSLGETVCFVELTTDALDDGMIALFEESINEEIRRARDVLEHVSAPGEAAVAERVTLKSELDSLGPPMPTRVIEVVGVDSCTCCGTHVRSTAELQAVKFLQTSKTRGNVRLHFVVGGRLLALAQQLLLNDARLSAMLSCGRADQVVSVERTQQQLAAARKQNKTLADELVALLAKDLYARITDNLIVYHRDDDNADFLNGLGQQLCALDAQAGRTTTMLLTCGTIPSSKKRKELAASGAPVPLVGTFAFFGATADSTKVHGAAIAELLAGKGFPGKRGPRACFTGKLGATACVAEAVEAARAAANTTSSAA